MNNRGAALILFYMIIGVLTVLGSAFLARTISENTIAQRYVDSASAFWIAESGMSQGFHNWQNGVGQPTTPVSCGGGNYSINVTAFPQVSVRGAYKNETRTINAYFVGVPPAFENTLSAGNNMSLLGALARVEVYGKTRISGNYSKPWGGSDYFENKLTGVDQNLTSIKINDFDGNGTADEFSDFVKFGQNALSSYDPNEVVYIKSNDTVDIYPDGSLVGKKAVFVEGGTPGKGSVNIVFDGTWAEGEDLTIISTGNITYVEPLQFQDNARLSTVSWYNYTEASVFRSQHESLIYSHRDTAMVDILEWGSNTGNIITNGNLTLVEALTYEKIYYSNRAYNGDLPPGFQLLGSSNSTNRKFRDWQE